MKPGCHVFIATSLDGFIARPDGDIDWLENANAVVPPGEDCGYQAFIDGIDAIVMGRKSFEKALGFVAWPYDKPVVVLSRRPLAIPPHLAKTVSASSETPPALIARLAAQGARRLYIDGGETIQGFLAAGLIDEITITLIPLLLGEGRRLFGPLSSDTALEPVAARQFDFGFVQLHYRVARQP